MLFSDTDFESVTATAVLTSYPRTFTDIPYEKEIFSKLQEKGIEDIPLNEKLAPEIEARYKLIDKLLKREKVDQVLELAAGYSARGLNFALQNKMFVEMELQSVCSKKIAILQSIIKEIPSNLHVISGNALDSKAYEQCKPFFDKHKKLGIINEGLLRYLTFDEKEVVARNIFSFLSEFPGVWITSDISPKAYLKSQNQNLSHFNDALSKVTPRNNLNDRFEDKNHIIDFFSRIGFDVKFYSYADVKDELYSPKVLNYSSEQTDALLSSGLVAVFSINNN